MDGDALFHELNILLKGVHDTQVWDSELKSLTQGRNLNNTLLAWGLPVAAARDSSVYINNKSFWATRPLSVMMLEWASGDVTSLFELYRKQVDVVSLSQSIECSRKSEENADFIRSKCHRRTAINDHNMGKLIGKGGSNLRRLTSLIPGSFIQLRGKFASGEISVYASNEKDLAKVIKYLRPYV